MDSILSKRGRNTLEFSNDRMDWIMKAWSNKYHPESNPQGIIDVGVAENKLCEDLVLARLSQNDIVSVEASELYYPAFHGCDSFREAIANLLNRRLNTTQELKAENMIVTSGVGCALDTLAHVIGDPGDCMLVPAPCYGNIPPDFGQRSQMNCINVHTDETASDGSVVFRLTLDKIVAAYEDALQKGEKVCGVMLINPHNPTGQLMELALVEDILNFAANEKLHVIFDEIFALSVYSGEFRSSVTHVKQLPDPSRTHLVWGFSKDLTLSGYRIGVIHSWSPQVLASVLPLSYFNACPGIVQKQMENLISDTEWLDTVFFPANHAAMLKGRNHVMSWLDKLQLPYTVPSAAFFLWADFSKYLTSATEEGGLELFEKLFNGGVYLEPGAFFCSRAPGFFRVLITAPRELTDRAFERIMAVLGE